MSSEAEHRADKFAERGITFRIAQKEDAQKIWQFIIDNFFPHEPMSRSLGLDKNRTLLDKICRHVTYDAFIAECLKQDVSILAVDEDGDIVGVKLAHIAKNTDKKVGLPNFRWLNSFLWMLPAQWSKLLAMLELVEKLKYNPWTIMEETGSENIYVGEVLCTSSKVRGLGLGRELATRSLELAIKGGCDGYLVQLTGIYSQKVYHDLGFQVLYRAEYSEEKDKYGRLIVHDAREHTHVETGFKSLSPSNTLA